LRIDAAVACVFSEIVADARRQGRRLKIMDTWIAPTAIMHDLPVYTQDDDFRGIPRARVIRV
jgi:predicted nucleic acid-binding protein